jgi:hypothetical protein
MADIDVKKKPAPAKAPAAPDAGGQRSLVLMLVAFLAVGGLMAWLAYETSRRPATTALDEEPAAQTANGATPFATVAAAPQQYEGQQVRVSGMPIAARLGPNVYWADVADGNPFVVFAAEGVGVAPGQTVTASGNVLPLDGAVVDGWVQAGGLNPEMRELAADASHYFQVVEVVAATPTTN